MSVTALKLHSVKLLVPVRGLLTQPIRNRDKRLQNDSIFTVPSQTRLKEVRMKEWKLRGVRCAMVRVGG